MAEPFLGQLSLYGFNFAPTGYAMCAGQIFPISQNTALFSLLGVNYGGNGTNTFALPDLRSRVPLGSGQGPGLQSYSVGEQVGVENVTVLGTNNPAHAHNFQASATNGATNSPANGVLAQGHGGGARGGFTINSYASPGTTTTLAPAQLSNAGGNNPHNNIQPYLAMNWCIALQGVFPARN